MVDLSESAQNLANARVRCRDCTLRIPLKRRKAVPNCQRCIDCEEVFVKISEKQQREGRA